MQAYICQLFCQSSISVLAGEIYSHLRGILQRNGYHEGSINRYHIILTVLNQSNNSIVFLSLSSADTWHRYLYFDSRT